MEIHIENLPRTVELLADEGGPVFQYIDERLLPGELRMAQTRDWRAVIEAIKVLAVRGAPAIGIAGAAAMALWAAYDGENLEAATEDIATARPTAVNLRWAVQRICDEIALSDECDAQTASFLQREVSDGIIAPSYSDAALEILKTKRKGTYLVLQMDPDYKPEPIETKQVFGITFEQQRNEIAITEDCLKEIPTQNKDLPAAAKRDLLIALITLKYTQSNSVCYAKDGQAIGIGAGQQSRVHCTRLAGSKADIWYLRQAPQVLALPFREDVRRPDRDNAIDVYVGPEYRDLLDGDNWKRVFTEKPPVFTEEEKQAWLATQAGVALGSDAFFPFGDNIERAHKSGVAYVAQAGGSIRDDNVIETCDKYNMTMAMTHIRLFHH